MRLGCEIASFECILYFLFLFLLLMECRLVSFFYDLYQKNVPLTLHYLNFQNSEMENRILNLQWITRIKIQIIIFDWSYFYHFYFLRIRIVFVKILDAIVFDIIFNKFKIDEM